MKFILTQEDIEGIVTTHMKNKFQVTPDKITMKSLGNLVTDVQIIITGEQEIDTIKKEELKKFGEATLGGAGENRKETEITPPWLTGNQVDTEV